MKKSEELAKRLGQSLSLTKQKTDNENQKNTAGQGSSQTTQENKKEISDKKIVKKNPENKAKKQVVKTAGTSNLENKLERVAVSLYDTDVKKANEIQVFMLQNGKRVSRSDAVKLALRSTKIDDELLKVFSEVKTEDRRRKPIV